MPTVVSRAATWLIKGLNVKADTGTARANSRACVQEGLYQLQLVPDENYAIPRAATLSASRGIS